MNISQGKLRIYSEVARCLKSGGIVAIPTDTVYGLGADPFNPAAVQKLYTMKGRPEENPIPLVLSSVSDVHRFSRNLPDFFFHLTDRFWPGGLTIVIESEGLLPVLTAGGNYCRSSDSRPSSTFENPPSVWWTRWQ